MKNKNIVLVVISFMLTGCAVVTDSAKLFLGTSTKALEEAREQASARSYDCSVEECFQAVLSLTHNTNVDEPMSGDSPFEMFQKNLEHGYIVVMGIKGQVDTTEVGIFLEAESEKQTRIEISSLSSGAKQKVADAVFNELALRFFER